MNKFPKGLDGRSRDRDGEIRHKRSDTKLETIRDTYKKDVAPGIRGDAKLGNVLKRTGKDSLSDLIKH